MACEARRELDEMVCRCGKRWDTKDPDPPACQPATPTTNFMFCSGKADPFPMEHGDRRYHVIPDQAQVDDGRKFNSAGLVRHVLGVKETATFSMCVEIAREAYAAGKAAK